MKQLRNTVYLLFIIIGALVSFGCTVNVDTGDNTADDEEKKAEFKKHMTDEYGGERTDHRPPHSLK